MLWKLLVDSFQADSDFFLLQIFENRKFWAAIKKKKIKKKDSGTHEEVKCVAL